jgi:hypothetical protein
MENDDLIPKEMGGDSGSDSMAHREPSELQSIRLKVLEGLADIERGEFTEYVGRAGLKLLSEDIVARGRERLALPKTDQV